MIIINHKESRSTRTLLLLTLYWVQNSHLFVEYHIYLLWNQANYNTSSSTFQPFVVLTSVVLQENIYGFAFRNISDLGPKQYMKQISLIITKYWSKSCPSRTMLNINMMFRNLLGKKWWKRVFWKQQQQNFCKTLWGFSATHAKKAGLVQMNISVVWLEELTIMHFLKNC